MSLQKILAVVIALIVLAAALTARHYTTSVVRLYDVRFFLCSIPGGPGPPQLCPSPCPRHSRSIDDLKTAISEAGLAHDIHETTPGSMQFRSGQFVIYNYRYQHLRIESLIDALAAEQGLVRL